MAISRANGKFQGPDTKHPQGKAFQGPDAPKPAKKEKAVKEKKEK